MSFITRNIGDVVSEILMSRTAFFGSLLVVEGDSDSKFFSRRVSRKDCQIVIAGGKPTVCGAVLAAYGKGQSGILGVVDDDYDSICGIPVSSAHIVCTEARDIEALLLSSQALELVIYELGLQAKISAFEANEGKTVRDALIARSLIFGKLRLLDKQNGWRVPFDQCSPWRFGNADSWTIDEAALIAHVCGKVNLQPSVLSAMLADVPVTDPFELLHGGDSISVLRMGLKSKLGKGQWAEEAICQALRLAFDDATALGTVLFQRIRDWETNNPPYRVFAY